MFFVLLTIFIVLSLVAYRVDNYAMFAWEAQIRWGNVAFDPKKFPQAPINERAKMLADLLRKKYFIDMPRAQVKEVFGPSTGGYYNYDVNLTYRIYKRKQTAWDLVLIIDHETHKVDRMILYRQSAGITKTILHGFMKFVDVLYE